MSVLIRIISVTLASALVSSAVVCMERKRPLGDDKETGQEDRNVRQRRIEAPNDVLAIVVARRACYTTCRVAEAVCKVAKAAVSLAVTLDGINERQAGFAEARLHHADAASYNHACIHAAALSAAAAAEAEAKNADDAAFEASRADDAAEAALVAAAKTRDAAYIALPAAPTDGRDYANVPVSDPAYLAYAAHRCAREAEAARVSPEAIAHLSPADFAFAAIHEAEVAVTFAHQAAEAARACALSQHNAMSDSAACACDTMAEAHAHIRERISPTRRELVLHAQASAHRAISAALCAEAAVKLASKDSLGLARAVHRALDAQHSAMRAYDDAVACLKRVRDTCKQPLHANCESAVCCKPPHALDVLGAVYVSDLSEDEA